MVFDCDDQHGISCVKIAVTGRILAMELPLRTVEIVGRSAKMCAPTASSTALVDRACNCTRLSRVSAMHQAKFTDRVNPRNFAIED